jgi:hypothetical protein
MGEWYCMDAIGFGIFNIVICNFFYFLIFLYPYNYLTTYYLLLTTYYLLLTTY